MRGFTLSALLLCVASCGDDDGGAPAVPTAAPTPGTGGAAAPGETEATPTTELTGTSSVQTVAPEPASGCPANEVEAQLERPGTVHRRDIEIDETLDLAGSPHRFEHGIHIEEGATLTAEPCALVLIGASGNVSVTGGAALVSEGEEGRPVRFDSESPDPAPGQWNAIRIRGSARPSTRLVHTIVEDAGSSRLGAAIYVDGEFALDVQHVTIRHSSQHGVRLNQEARFHEDATNLVVTESGREDPYSAPVWFSSATQVRTLPDGEYTGNAYDEIWVERGHVRTTGTWRNPGVRYRLNAGLTVGHETGPVLTIAPGATLAFNRDKALAVGFRGDGALVLDGESEETPITLTSGRPLPAAGDWAGVRIGEGRSDAVTKLNYVIVEHAGAETRHPHHASERLACRETGAAGVAIRDHDLDDRISNVTFRSLAEDAAAFLLVFRGEGTDYTAEALGNDFSEAGTECRQNLQPEGDCPEPACR